LCVLAAELGQSPARLAIAWCLRNRHVSSVILGASRVAQLEENLGALETLSQVDEAGWARVESSTR
ncbi:aldo/keto reductase, partial [Xanthomonas oryzae pv. oryzae]